MKLLFVSAQLAGHLDWGGYLPTALALKHRQHQVLWASGPAIQPAVEAAGLPFHPLAETGWRWPPPPPIRPEELGQSPEERQWARQMRALDQWLEEERVAQATQELLALVEQFRPDVIVGEMFMAAAALAAERTQTPFVVAGWAAPAPGGPRTDATSPALAEAQARVQRLLDRFGVPGHNWTLQGAPAITSPHLHISYWSPGWFQGVSLGSQTRHVGGRVPWDPASGPPPPPADLPSPEDAPWVFITLGTSFNRDPNFFLAAAHAAVELGCLPLLAVGEPPQTPWVAQMRGRLPQTAVVRGRLDFRAVLPHVAAAIHHGGAGTTHALVIHGIPQIVVPHAGDQWRQAAGVMRTGVGLHIPAREVTIPRLVEGLAALLPDRSPYRERALACQAEFARLGGVPRAADLLEALGPAAGRP
ncbi:MAG: hypothetical protein KatS3mg050_0403 [Litorilinea sp.]|nr:MAG: hypothetical protein KatS3mg050_0403 [Litorilinea sp.]